MPSEQLDVSILVPEDIYQVERPKFKDGVMVEEPDFLWDCDDETLAALQDITVEAAYSLGIEVAPMLAPAIVRENTISVLRGNRHMILSYKPTTEAVTALCKTAWSHIYHSIVFGHPEDEPPHITCPTRRTIEIINAPAERIFVQGIAPHVLNRDELKDTIKRAMDFTCNNPLFG